MSSLVERIIKDRMLEIKFKHMTFFARRPTYEEVGKNYSTETTNAELAREFVSGWSGVKEADLLKGGDAEVDVPFDATLWRLASGDMNDACTFIAKELINKCMAYAGETVDSAKN